MRKSFTLYRILLILAATLPFVTANAQNQIPNHDFETWVAGEPESWDTSNENILGTDFITVTREQNNPFSGSASAKVATVTNNIFLVGPVTMPGIMTLGDVVIDVLNATGTVIGGIPVTGQPKFLKGYYKYEPQGGDSCYFGIGLSRWNGTSRDTLAFSYTPFGSNVSTWTEFTVPVEYVIWAEPDSMNIMFLSSNLMYGTPVTGSTLWVDSLWLEYSGVGIQDIGLDKEFFVSASAEGNSLILTSRGETINEIEIYSLSGMKVSAIKGTSDAKIAVNISHLGRGTYIVRTLLNNNRVKAVKFSKL